jgi:hypothetical protein
VFGTLTALGLVLTLAALLTSSRSKEDGHGLTRPLSEAHAGRRRTTAGVNEREAWRREGTRWLFGPRPRYAELAVRFPADKRKENRNGRLRLQARARGRDTR